MQPFVIQRVAQDPVVSILIRSSDRMQRCPRVVITRSRKFQSSSDHQTGCSSSWVVHFSFHHMFQSSSDHQTGCSRFSGHRSPVPLRFQSSSDHQTGCSIPRHRISGDDQIVSILIRSSDRMQRWQWIAPAGNMRRFNPHPIIRPDAAGGGLFACKALAVSILIRSSDRMQPLPIPPRS